MQLKINGNIQNYDGQPDIPSLLDWLSIPKETALVELNGVALFRRDWQSTSLKDGDVIEILQIAAGG
ncbi:MAG: sulfur carrier protein ThiS [Chthoniobacterales bacterium]|nr:sulfur carrier protein ThiS [Chthoniobacterales bacterium]